MYNTHKLSKKRNVLLAFFGLIFAQGILSLFFFVIIFIVTFPSNYWPSVPGIVTSSSFVARGGSVTPSDEWHQFKISYKYVVAGKKYTGNRLSVITFQPRAREAAQQLLEQYPVGASVTVYYYPKNPQKSALVAGIPSKVYIGFFVSSGITLFGLIGLGFVSGRFRPFFALLKT